ncbi:MAG: class I SAM-dependent methyltransferase [Candidatus Acidiferrales bacterium]
MPANFQSRYGQAAADYLTYRPDYPAEIFERILAVVPAERRNRAIDLGAGTGKSTRILAQSFAEVIAVEADPLMAEQLRANAPSAIVRIAIAEDFACDPASADLVNVATALRWMDGPRVLENVARWLRPDGILAAYGYHPPGTPEPIRSIVRKEFEDHWNQHLDPRLLDTNLERGLIQQARGLRVVGDRQIANFVPYTAQDFLGFCRSTSYGSAYARTLADPESYWRNLESRFRAASGDAKIPVDFNLWFILARRDS